MIAAIFVLTTVGTILFMLRVTWQCGLCGKINHTNFFQFFFYMCDHGGGAQ